MSDYEAIQGTWKVVAGPKQGLTIPVGPTQFGSKLLYRLHPSKSPKEIELRHRDPGHRPRSSCRGIYTLDEDNLAICWVYEGRRPKRFSSNADFDSNVLRLQREETP